MFTDGVHYFLYIGIQVFGPGPSRFYQPTSQPVPVTSPQMNTPQPLYSTQQAASSQSTENGSTTKLLTVC